MGRGGYVDNYSYLPPILPHGRGIPPPPSRIPPYYTVRMSYRGDNPVYEIKIFLGKNLSPSLKGRRIYLSLWNIV